MAKNKIANKLSSKIIISVLKSFLKLGFLEVLSSEISTWDFPFECARKYNFLKFNLLNYSVVYNSFLLGQVQKLSKYGYYLLGRKYIQFRTLI